MKTYLLIIKIFDEIKCCTIYIYYYDQQILISSLYKEKSIKCLYYLIYYLQLLYENKILLIF